MKSESYYDNARLDVVSLIPDGAYPRILEVGGGDFPTLCKLREDHKAEIWGVDVRSPSMKFENFIDGSITDPSVVSQLPEGSFDLVVANDVIEHVEQTEEFFNILHGLLRPDGILALSVPNIRQVRTAYKIFICGTFPRDDAGLFDRTHLRWFCKKDVATLASRSGFTLKDWRGTGRLVPTIIARTAIAEFLALQNLFIFAK